MSGLQVKIELDDASVAQIVQPVRESHQECAVGMKRKREDLDLLRERLEILKLEEEIKAKEQTRVFAAIAELERIRDPARCNLDEMTRLMVQDSMLSTLVMHPLPPVQSHKPITIEEVAAELGYKLTSEDLKRVEADVEKRYIEKYGRPPPKRWVYKQDDSGSSSGGAGCV